MSDYTKEPVAHEASYAPIYLIKHFGRIVAKCYDIAAANKVLFALQQLETKDSAQPALEPAMNTDREGGGE